MPRFTPAPAPKCPRCGDSIFATELKLGPNAVPYHVQCLTCSQCNKRLDSTLLLEHEGQPYCKHCHAKLLGTGANGFTRAVPLQPRSPEAAGVKVGAFASPASPSNQVLAAATAAGSVGARGAASTASPLGHRTTSSVSSTASSSRVHTSAHTTAPSSFSTSADEQTARLPHQVKGTSPSRPTGSNSLSQDRPTAEPYDPEFGPIPVSRTSHAQTMDDLVNQVDAITVRPRGIGVAPVSVALTDRGSSESDDADSTLDTASTVATVGTPGLPPPRRLAPSRHGATGAAYRTAPPAGGGTSGLTRLGLGSSVSAAAGGTPLCARCSKPVYFAEQKQGAGRKWHRACLRCDGCSTILESGRLEEGPGDGAELAATLNPQGGAAANIWCKNCYAKHFGPKGIGVGLSMPDALRR